MIIEPGRTTLATVMRRAGYRTGVVGKWHLGLGAGDLDWNGEIKPSPLDIGFDESFIMAATGARVPCVYVRDRRVVGLDPADPIEVRYGQPIPGEPTGKQNPELLKVHPSHGHDMAIVNGVSRIGHMKGGRKALWIDEEMADVFTKEAVEFIGRHKEKPFFLYFATHDVHIPASRTRGSSARAAWGPAGDALLEFYWSVGQILKTLDEAGLAENTLVLLSSDNGPVIDDGYQDDAVEKLGDHKPAGPFRGGKYSKFEGGTASLDRPLAGEGPARHLGRPGVPGRLRRRVRGARRSAHLGRHRPRQRGPAPRPSSASRKPAAGNSSNTGTASPSATGPGSGSPAPKGRRRTARRTPNSATRPEGMLFHLSDDPGGRFSTRRGGRELVLAVAGGGDRGGADRQRVATRRRPGAPSSAGRTLPAFGDEFPLSLALPPPKAGPGRTSTASSTVAAFGAPGDRAVVATRVGRLVGSSRVVSSASGAALCSAGAVTSSCGDVDVVRRRRTRLSIVSVLVGICRSSSIHPCRPISDRPARPAARSSGVLRRSARHRSGWVEIDSARGDQGRRTPANSWAYSARISPFQVPGAQRRGADAVGRPPPLTMTSPGSMTIRARPDDRPRGGPPRSGSGEIPRWWEAVGGRLSSAEAIGRHGLHPRKSP